MTTNRLVDGLIPAGQACPFIDNCKFKFALCPTKEKTRAIPFSCAAARLHNAIERADQSSAFVALAAQILSKEPERQIPDERPTIPDIVINDDDGYTD